jgi:hypothetical protein
MSEPSISGPPQKNSKWFDPRRPKLFILQGTIFYAGVTTFCQTLWNYFEQHKPEAAKISEISSRALANAIAGTAVVALFWYRSKKKLETDLSR